MKHTNNIPSSTIADLDAITKSIGRNFDKVHGKTKPSKDPVDKAIRRNATAVVKRMKPAFDALMAELGIGKTAVDKYTNIVDAHDAFEAHLQSNK
jgi:hypothetical protein